MLGTGIHELFIIFSLGPPQTRERDKDKIQDRGNGRDLVSITTLTTYRSISTQASSPTIPIGVGAPSGSGQEIRGKRHKLLHEESTKLEEIEAGS